MTNLPNYKLNEKELIDGIDRVEDSDYKNVSLKDSERQPCEVWTRVMGYHRPKDSFNKGKQSEFNERKNFTEAKAVARMAEEEACQDGSKD